MTAVPDPLVEHILAARASAVTSTPPGEGRTLSLADAYDTQDRVRQALVARGERVIGWKAGFTSRATQKMFDTDRPVCGFLLGSGVYASGAEVPASGFVGLAVEAEVALVMGRALAGPGVAPPQALLAVERAVPALELVDFRYAGKPSAIDVVMTGSVSAVLRPKAGDTVRARFTRLGMVAARFV
jgi:2-keto-4-pentenoate hydratase